MTKVIFEKNDSKNEITLSVSGHSMSDTRGKDLVCASVSTLTFTIAQYVNFMFKADKLRGKPEINLDPENTVIKIHVKKDDWAESLVAFSVSQTGFFLLANNYPNNVELKRFDEE